MERSQSHDVAAIVAYLRNTLGVESATGESLLFQIGGIDSMALLELVDFVESHFKTSVKSNEITIANFSTPARIAEVFAAKR